MYFYWKDFGPQKANLSLIVDPSLTSHKLEPPSNFIAGHSKAALVFWFFGGFRCGVWLCFGCQLSPIRPVMQEGCITSTSNEGLNLLHSERPKLYTILVFLSAIRLNQSFNKFILEARVGKKTLRN